MLELPEGRMPACFILFFHFLSVKMKFQVLIMRVINHGNKVPREVENFPMLQHFKSRLMTFWEICSHYTKYWAWYININYIYIYIYIWIHLDLRAGILISQEEVDSKWQIVEFTQLGWWVHLRCKNPRWGKAVFHLQLTKQPCVAASEYSMFCACNCT